MEIDLGLLCSWTEINSDNTMDKELQSYIWGLMATDGSMRKIVSSKGKPSYSCKIELVDRQVLQDLADKLGVTVYHRKRVIAGKEREFWSITIPHYVYMPYGECFRDSRLGMYDLYQQSDKDAFIRGMFDGDGSISHYKVKGRHGHLYIYPRACWVINSKHQDLITIWNEYCQENGWYAYTYVDKRGNTAVNYQISAKDNIKEFFTYMYGNSPSVFLKRKYDKFIDQGFPDLVTDGKKHSELRAEVSSDC